MGWEEKTRGNKKLFKSAKTKLNMADKEVSPAYHSEGGIDINVRLNDLEERTNNLREKVNLVSKNFIIIKEELDERLDKIKKENFILNKNYERLRRVVEMLAQESEKWVRRDEMILIERMLKDFQPLEFVRKKDLDEILKKNHKLNGPLASEKNKKPKKVK